MHSKLPVDAMVVDHKTFQHMLQSVHVNEGDHIHSVGTVHELADTFSSRGLTLDVG